MAMRLQRLRMAVKLAAGVGSALACAVTLVWPDWIERLSGLDPDGGRGDAEWGVVLTLGMVAISSLALAWRDWRGLAKA